MHMLQVSQWHMANKQNDRLNRSVEQDKRFFSSYNSLLILIGGTQHNIQIQLLARTVLS